MRKLLFILLVLQFNFGYSITESELKKQLQQNPKNLQTYQTLLSLEKSKDSIAALGKEALEHLGTKSAIYTSMGNAYANIKEHNLAIDAFRQAVNLNPKAPSINNRLGLALIHIGFYRQAEVSYKAAIAYASSEAAKVQYYVNLAHTLVQLQNQKEAKEVLFKALVIDPNYKAALDMMKILSS